MMARCFFLLLLSLAACTPKSSTSTQIEQDTVFLLNNSPHHAIYIDSATNTKLYQNLTDFSFNRYDSTNYTAIADDIIQKFPDAFQKYDLQQLPTHWLPLYPYQQKLYLYAPCDWGYLAQRQFSDTSFIVKYMDGPFPVPFEQVTNTSDQAYRLTFHHSSDLYHNINIDILDTTTSLSLWEFIDQSGDKYHQIYIPQEFASRYQVIVNDCRSDKEDEFTFDQIDFDSLKKTYLGGE